MSNKIDTFMNPVLIIAFNRFSKFKEVFDQVIKGGSKSLYISLDGPRVGNKEDLINIKKTLDYIALYRDSMEINLKQAAANKGCRKNVIDSISWFFRNEEQGIILEDDCVPSVAFFDFVNTMLTKYKLDKNIFTISGSNYMNYDHSSPENYFISNFVNVWGWATWSDRWSLYIDSLNNYHDKKIETILHNSLHNSRSEKYFFSMLKAVDLKILDTWDYNLAFTSFYYNLKNIHPYSSLITNIGFDLNATHTLRVPPWINEISSNSIDLNNNSYDLYIKERIHTYKIIHNILILKILHSKIFRITRKYIAKFVRIFTERI